MANISVVIVCKNEAAIIGNTLQSVAGLTDDVIIYDNGSEDGTVETAKQFDVRVEQGSWEGFGPTKRKANAMAKYDWILSLDADEAIDDELKKNLSALVTEEENTVYEIRFKNFFGRQWLKHGEWGGDKHTRLFNRSKTNWDDAPVHEQLIFPRDVKVKKINGYILHYTAMDIAKYRAKMVQYAGLNAKKYFEQGKRPGGLKKYMAAFFSFTQNYIFRAGFLDGKAGYQCAMITARYSFDKYKNLEKLIDKRE